VKTAIPQGSVNAHWSSLFGADTVQIMTGAPIFVYAKSLGASSTVLGLIVAFAPLMSVFQLPAARHLGRHGYRRFTALGWSARAALIVVIAMTSFMTFLDHSSRLAALLVLLFFLGFLRGIFSAAWMPWITHLIPEHLRGRFLSIDQLFMHGGSLASLLASALLVSGTADDALGSYEAVTGIFHWKRHSIYFFSLLALNVLVSACIPRLHESSFRNAAFGHN
jgi:MFS family permease